MAKSISFLAGALLFGLIFALAVITFSSLSYAEVPPTSGSNGDAEIPPVPPTSQSDGDALPNAVLSGLCVIPSTSYSPYAVDVSGGRVRLSNQEFNMSLSQGIYGVTNGSADIYAVVYSSGSGQPSINSMASDKTLPTSVKDSIKIATAQFNASSVLTSITNVFAGCSNYTKPTTQVVDGPRSGGGGPMAPTNLNPSAPADYAASFGKFADYAASFGTFNEKFLYTEGGLIVYWETGNPSIGKILYGSVPIKITDEKANNFGYMLVTPEEKVYSSAHSITIKNMEPNLRYYLRTLSNNGKYLHLSNEYSFVIPPAPKNSAGIKELTPTPPQQIKTEVSSSCKPEINASYLKSGIKNDATEVLKLQRFLNDREKANLSLSGVYDSATESAVSKFQTKYADEILSPWQTNSPTGEVSITTLQKINSLVCGTLIPLSSDNQARIPAILKNLAKATITDGGFANALPTITHTAVAKSVTPDSTTTSLATDKKAEKSFLSNVATAIVGAPKAVFRIIGNFFDFLGKK